MIRLQIMLLKFGYSLVLVAIILILLERYT